MANPEHVARLREGRTTWNQWRWQYPDVPVDLCGADLCGANLSAMNLRWANLRRASLIKADLHGSNLFGAKLSQANLSGANLRWAYLPIASLIRANLWEADLHAANLAGASLRWANLCLARLGEARLVGACLRGANLQQVLLHGANLEGADLRGISCLLLRELTLQPGTNFTGILFDHLPDEKDLATSLSENGFSTTPSGALPLSFISGLGGPSLGLKKRLSDNSQLVETFLHSGTDTQNRDKPYQESPSSQGASRKREHEINGPTS